MREELSQGGMVILTLIFLSNIIATRSIRSERSPLNHSLPLLINLLNDLEHFDDSFNPAIRTHLIDFLTWKPDNLFQSHLSALAARRRYLSRYTYLLF